mmetsp:Transcript_31191/g.92634  ORF Transcript_31191/g.92634 Transcript_31191/m.92634 type:complete len:227 (-) Transcript_31191:387-1067(-)
MGTPCCGPCWFGTQMLPLPSCCCCAIQPLSWRLEAGTMTMPAGTIAPPGPGVTMQTGTMPAWPMFMAWPMFTAWPMPLDIICCGMYWYHCWAPIGCVSGESGVVGLLRSLPPAVVLSQLCVCPLWRPVSAPQLPQKRLAPQEWQHRPERFLPLLALLDPDPCEFVRLTECGERIDWWVPFWGMAGFSAPGASQTTMPPFSASSPLVLPYSRASSGDMGSNDVGSAR